MDKERFAVALMACNGAYDNCNTAQGICTKDSIMQILS